MKLSRPIRNPFDLAPVLLLIAGIFTAPAWAVQERVAGVNDSRDATAPVPAASTHITEPGPHRVPAADQPGQGTDDRGEWLFDLNQQSDEVRSRAHV